jgi:hypothetical protein
MIICFIFGGQEHCFPVPVIEIPIVIPRLPGPGPINYPPFISDAVIVTSLQSLATKISDTNVREAAERGHLAAIEAMQKHIGSEVKIRTE